MISISRRQKTLKTPKALRLWNEVKITKDNKNIFKILEKLSYYSYINTLCQMEIKDYDNYILVNVDIITSFDAKIFNKMKWVKEQQLKQIKQIIGEIKNEA